VCRAGRDGSARSAQHQWQDFTGQGQAIAKNAASDVRILVVAILAHELPDRDEHAKDVPTERWHAMRVLDANRANRKLAQKAVCTSEAAFFAMAGLGR